MTRNADVIRNITARVCLKRFEVSFRVFERLCESNTDYFVVRLELLCDFGLFVFF